MSMHMVANIRDSNNKAQILRYCAVADNNIMKEYKFPIEVQPNIADANDTQCMDCLNFIIHSKNPNLKWVK